MDGIEFLKKVRKNHPYLPFILFTGQGSEEIASEAISAGVTDYIQKEIGSDQYKILGNKIQNSVDHYYSKKNLIKSEKNLRKLIDHIPDVLFVIDEDGKFLLVNQKHADFHDTTVKKLEGTKASKILTNPEFKKFYNDIQEVIESGEPKCLDGVEITDPQGNIHIFQPQLIPYDFIGSNKKTVLGIVDDITEQKQREKNLYRYKKLIEEIPDGVVMVDEDGKYTFVNKIASGPYSSDDWIEKSVSTLSELYPISDDVVSEHQKAIDNILNRDKEHETHTFTVNHSDFGELILEARFSLVENDQGEKIGVVGITRDITEKEKNRKQLEKEREKYSNLVEQSHDGVLVVQDKKNSFHKSKL